VLGDSNNPNPPTGGLSYGKSQDFGLNLTAMPPGPLSASVRQSSRRCLVEKGRGRGLISNSLSTSNGIGIALAGGVLKIHFLQNAYYYLSATYKF